MTILALIWFREITNQEQVCAMSSVSSGSSMADRKGLVGVVGRPWSGNLVLDLETYSWSCFHVCDLGQVTWFLWASVSQLFWEPAGSDQKFSKPLRPTLCHGACSLLNYSSMSAWLFFCDQKLGFGSELRNSWCLCFSSFHLLAAESYKDTQMVKVKEEPMDVDVQDSPASVSPSRNVGYSTLIGREKTEPLQKLPEGRVPPERNLFSQDISVKMASELLFQLSGTFPGGGKCQ